MVDTNHAFVIGTNGGRVETGVGEHQVGPIAFSSGGRAFGTEAPAVSGMVMFDGVQTVTATSSTNENVTGSFEDINSVAGGLQENVAIPDFTVNNLDQTTGRFTFNDGTTGSSARVGYFINSSRRVVIPIDPTVTTPWILIDDNQ
jgi:hypothetical protein